MFFIMVFIHQVLLLRSADRLLDDVDRGLDPDVARLEAKRFSVYWEETTRDWVTTQPEVLNR